MNKKTKKSSRAKMKSRVKKVAPTRIKPSKYGQKKKEGHGVKVAPVAEQPMSEPIEEFNLEKTQVKEKNET